jgi:hypothetical protein
MRSHTSLVNGFAPKPGGGYTTPNGQEVPHDDTKKPWYDIRGDTKKELLVSYSMWSHSDVTAFLISN